MTQNILGQGWKIYKIGDIAKIISGSTPDTNEQSYWNGTIPWITPVDLTNGHNWYISNTIRKITEYGMSSCSTQLLPKGTVLLTSRAPIGKVAIAGVPMCTNQGFKNFICNESKLHNEYLYYFLRNRKDYLNNLGRGATFKEISKSIVENIKIPLPPLPEQKRIAAILDKADAIRRKRRETILLLDEFLRSTFLWMFGDPVKNEKGWTKRKLEEVCEIVTGNTPSRDESENYGNFIEWIKSDNINTPYHFISKADEYLSKIGLQKGRSIDKDSILMTCIAGSLNCIGNVALVNRKVAFNQQINGMVPVNINLFFLYVQFLVSKKYIQSASTNSMKGMISKGTLSKLEFIVPPDKAQRVFANFFLRYIRERELLEKSLAEMENNFNSLMQRAFRGEM
jgi:type I restriction enzyme S subunit